MASCFTGGAVASVDAIKKVLSGALLSSRRCVMLLERETSSQQMPLVGTRLCLTCCALHCGFSFTIPQFGELQLCLNKFTAVPENMTVAFTFDNAPHEALLLNGDLDQCQFSKMAGAHCWRWYKEKLTFML